MRVLFNLYYMHYLHVNIYFVLTQTYPEYGDFPRIVTIDLLYLYHSDDYRVFILFSHDTVNNSREKRLNIS